MGHRDVLLINVCEWLLIFESRKGLLLYCSDVAGAFDRIPTERLLQKLFLTGMHGKLFILLSSWLRNRESAVVVSGVESSWKPILDQVFQGTVLGPPLWNLYFADFGRPLTDLDFEHTTFADDMNAWQSFDGLAILLNAQSKVHEYGNANQVQLDACKESFHYLHAQDGFSFSGDPSFRILGCEFDCKLLMHEAVHSISAEAGWRLRSLLRSQRYFNTSRLVLLYKSLVLSYIESLTPAIYHAADSVLGKIDRIQDRFLERLHLSQKEAFA